MKRVSIEKFDEGIEIINCLANGRSQIKREDNTEQPTKLAL